MKTSLSKVEIQLINQTTITLKAQYFLIKQEGFDANLLMNLKERIFLLKKSHKSCITTINLTQLTPYVILQFNIDKEFTGASFSLNALHTPFSLKAMADYFLLLPYPLAFKLQEVKSISY